MIDEKKCNELKFEKIIQFQFLHFFLGFFFYYWYMLFKSLFFSRHIDN